MVRTNVSHMFSFKNIIASIHFSRCPSERRDRFRSMSDDRVIEVRDTIIESELDALRVDHDEAKILRWVPVEQRSDHRVHHHRLTGAGRTRDEEVRHLRQVGIMQFSGNTFSKRHEKGSR